MQNPYNDEAILCSTDTFYYPRILLVESNKRLKFTHKKVFKQLGYDVHCVRRGCHALKALHHGYGLIFINIALLDISAVSLCAAIRAEEKERSLPNTIILGLTEKALAEEERIKYLSAGMNNVLVIPPLNSSLPYHC